jgi:hypothetical protein
MPMCKDCKNYFSDNEIDGHCLAADEELVEGDRDSVDCLANAFESKNKEDTL